MKFAKNFNNKKFCPKKISPKKIAKKCWPKRNFGKKFFFDKNIFCAKRNFAPQNFANKKFVNEKFFSLKIKLLKKICQEIILSQKFIAKKKFSLIFFFKFYFLVQRAKIFGINVFLGQKFFRKRILRINFFGTKLCFLAQPLLRPSSRLTVSAWVSPSSTPACSSCDRGKTKSASSLEPKSEV